MAGGAETKQAELEAPLSYVNWKRAMGDATMVSGYEYPLFTDAHIIGEIGEGCGPYQFINTVPLPSLRRVRPSIILVVKGYIKGDEFLARMDETFEGAYHGGGLQDELAALLSLSLGIRCKAGGATRAFNGDGDRGRPITWGFDRDPILPEVHDRVVIPAAIGEHRLEKASLLCNLHRLTPKAAITLVRTARLYQDALWVAESQGHLSWLMFVSAVETAAQYWRNEKESPLERMRTSRPELESLLRDEGGEAFVQKVAEQIGPYMGATRTFIDFLLEYLPAPPPDRPPEAFQVTWTKREMKQIFRKIYQYRSRALHGGTPFPAPMCEPPWQVTEHYLEKPSGHATGMLGSTWLADDTPILLHTFEYIVRHAVLGWWDSLIADIPGTSDDSDS